MNRSIKSVRKKVILKMSHFFCVTLFHEYDNVCLKNIKIVTNNRDFVFQVFYNVMSKSGLVTVAK